MRTIYQHRRPLVSTNWCWSLCFVPVHLSIFARNPWTSVPFASGWTFTLISQDESIHIFVAVKPWASVSYTDHQLIHRDAIAEYVESRMNDAGMEWLYHVILQLPFFDVFCWWQIPLCTHIPIVFTWYGWPEPIHPMSLDRTELSGQVNHG